LPHVEITDNLNNPYGFGAGAGRRLQASNGVEEATTLAFGSADLAF